MGTRLVIAPGREALVERLGLVDPRRVPSERFGDRVNDGPTRNVQRIDDDGRIWFLKVYRYPWRRPRRLLTFMYRKSRARTEYESLAYLREHGLPAVEPIAFGSHRVGPLIRSCFLLTKGVEGVEGDDFLVSFSNRSRAARRRLIITVADLVRRMHAVDHFHYDLKFRNILVHEDGETFRLSLLDFPKGEVIPATRRSAHRAARVWDLATLAKHAPRWFSRSERLLWFTTYLGYPLDAEARRLACEVEELRQHLLAKRT